MARWRGQGPSRGDGYVQLSGRTSQVGGCRRVLPQVERNAGGKKAGLVYRLPTEAEWEYACRAGTETAFHFGDSLDSNQSKFLGRFPFGDAEKGPFRNRTTAAGSFKSNAFGLYDMHGNVWEWCSNWYRRDYYKNSPVDDPQGPGRGTRRVIRGGDCRTAFRCAGLPRGTFYATGMRVVMTLGDSSGDSTLASLTAEPTTPQVKAELATDADASSSDTGGEDWPRWRGPRGDGTWQGAKLPERWPDGGLRRVWRQPVGGGYAGVAVARGQVYLMDRQVGSQESERLLCFNATTGELIWKHRYPVDYTDVAYGNGPRTTPAIFDSRVYVLGATGQLYCLHAETGTPIWSTELVNDHQARIPIWGFCASPFVFENLLIVHAGAEPDGCLIAFNRTTGKKVWSSLSDPAGYVTTIVAAIDGKQHLVCWTPTHVRSVDARSGEPLWSVPYKCRQRHVHRDANLTGRNCPGQRLLRRHQSDSIGPIMPPGLTAEFLLADLRIRAGRLEGDIEDGLLFIVPEPTGHHIVILATTSTAFFARRRAPTANDYRT